MPGKRDFDYNPEPFQNLLRQLLDETGESYRQAGLASGLSGTTISNYLRETSPSRPMRDACIALADHFGINPNEMLEAVGYEPLHFFDRRIIDPNALPPDIDQLTGEIMQIENDIVRKEVVDTLRQVLRIQMQVRDGASKKPLKEAGLRTETVSS